MKTFLDFMYEIRGVILVPELHVRKLFKCPHIKLTRHFLATVTIYTLAVAVVGVPGGESPCNCH